jgi:hypothetical protein
MKWRNLKKNKCPKCDKDFMIGLTTHPNDKGQVLVHPCGFAISERKYTMIVNSQVSADLERQFDELNEEDEQ